MNCLEATKVEHYDVKGDEFAVAKAADHNKTSVTYGEAKLVMDKEVVTPVWIFLLRRAKNCPKKEMREVH